MEVLRQQILTNATFLYGPNKNFRIVTALVFVGQYGHIKASQCILLDVNDEGTFKTYLVGGASERLEDALESLHGETRKLIYGKLSETLEENAMIEPGETTLEGTVEWE